MHWLLDFHFKNLYTHQTRYEWLESYLGEIVLLDKTIRDNTILFKWGKGVHKVIQSVDYNNFFPGFSTLFVCV